MYPDREYSSADAVFSNTDCEEEDWLDMLVLSQVSFCSCRCMLVLTDDD